MNQNIPETNPNQLKSETEPIKQTGLEVSADFETSKEDATSKHLVDNEKIKEPKEKKSVSLPKIKKTAPAPPMLRDEMTLKVEKILSEGLEEDYKKLPPIVQQEFKLKGEQTASKISQLLKNTKVKIKNIFQLILEWLSLLPNVNRFFLEQEAKIKTDRVVNLKNQSH